MGLDSKLFELGSPTPLGGLHHHDEVETVTVYKGAAPTTAHGDCSESCSHCASGSPGENSPHVEESGDGPGETVPEAELAGALGSLSKETVWRVKGFVRLERGYCILNWAFGRYDLTPVESVPEHTGEVKLTVMGERGEVKRAARKLATRIGAEVA